MYCSQKLGEDFAKFCGLLRIYELYSLIFTINTFETLTIFMLIVRDCFFSLNGIFIFLSFLIYFEIAHFLQLKFRSIFKHNYQRKKYVLQNKEKITNHDSDFLL